MLSFTSDALQALIAGLIFPLTRILGVIASAPILNHPAVPNRVKLGLGIVLTTAISPLLVNMPNIVIFSFQGLAVLVDQLVIGIAMGFSMRIVFSAVEMCGFLTGTTMGLGFASFYDPQTHGQSMALSQMLVLVTMLLFLSMDGHLIIVSSLAESFVWLPISTQMVWIHPMDIAKWGADIFSTGLLLAMPMIATLLMVNIAMGILSKSAPQLNLFGIGFPVTIFTGILLLSIVLPAMQQPILHLIDQGFTHMHTTSGAPK